MKERCSWLQFIARSADSVRKTQRLMFCKITRRWMQPHHEHEYNQRSWPEALGTESKAQLLRHPELDEALRPVPFRTISWRWALISRAFHTALGTSLYAIYSLWTKHPLGGGEKKNCNKSSLNSHSRVELKKSWREKTEVLSTILGMLMTQPSTCKATLITWKFLSDCKSSK